MSFKKTSKFRIRQKVSIVFGVVAFLATMLSLMVIGEDFRVSDSWSYGLINGVIAWFWATLCFGQIDIKGTPTTKTIEALGITYGLTLVLLTFITPPIIIGITLFLSNPVLSKDCFLIIPIWLLIGSLYTVGIPYLSGMLTGMWAAHYVFRKTVLLH